MSEGKLVPVRREIAATARELFDITGIYPDKCSGDQREVLAAFAFGFAVSPHLVKFEQLSESQALGNVSALTTGLLLDALQFSLKEAAELTYPLVDASFPWTANRAINIVIDRGITAYGQWQDGQIKLVRKNLKETLGSVRTFPKLAPHRGSLFSADPKFPLREKREKVYEKYLGNLWDVNREINERKPQIDVYVLEPESDEIPFKMITGGMSDYPMNVPKGASPFRRGELVLYVEQPKQVYYDLLRYLAHKPHEQKSLWYACGTTISNGPNMDECQPFFKNSELDCILFLDSIVEEDGKIHEKLVLESDPVNLLWVVPITSSECKFVNRRSKDNDWMGRNQFFDILDRRNHPLILDEKRKSYVRKKVK